MPPTRKRDVCLVDGYNVIHKVPCLSRLLKSNRDEEARAELREACLRFSLRRRMRVLLVFDGSRAVRAPAPPSDANVEVVYASGAGKADGWILERAERLSGQRESVLVITEDRGIKNALPAKVRTMSANAFWTAIGPKAKAEIEEKPAPVLEDVEAYFLEAERRQKESGQKRPRK